MAMKDTKEIRQLFSQVASGLVLQHASWFVNCGNQLQILPAPLSVGV
jgi:hypothetical protein